MNEYPRVAGRLGNIINLNVTFFHNGMPQAPFAIRRVDIFKDSIRQGNLVTQIHFPLPNHINYPSPAVQDPQHPGVFDLKFLVPDTFIPGDIYYDVWNYIGNPPIPLEEGTGATGSTGTSIITGTDEIVADLGNNALWLSETGQFWIFEDDWVTDDLLLTPRLAFEPLDKRLRKGEIRTVEVAIHPLPSSKFDFNQLAPLIPNLEPTVSFATTNCEPIAGMVDRPCAMGIRQGHTNDSPFVIQFQIDTKNLLIGTYRYEIKVKLGIETIISEPMHLVVE